MCFHEKYNVKFEKNYDMAMLGMTKRGANGFRSTGGITKVIKLDDSLILKIMKIKC